MALPPLVKTWQFRVNQIASGASSDEICRRLLFAIKQTLVGAGSGWTDREGNALAGAPVGAWQVAGSCSYNPLNGTGASGMDGVDRWTSWETVNGSNARKAWIVLKHPTIDLWLFLVAPMNNWYSLWVHFARTPYTGGGEWVWPTSTTDVEVAQSAFGGPSSASTTSLHAWLATDGTARIAITRNGLTNLLVFGETVAAPAAGWTYPYFCGSGGSPNAASGDAVTQQLNGVSLTPEDASSGVRVTGMTDLNESRSLVNGLDTPNSNGRYPITPALLQGIGNPIRGIMGAPVDWYFSQDVLPTGTCFDDGAASSRDWIKLGRQAYVFPWNRSSPIINPAGVEPTHAIYGAEYALAASAPASTPPTVEDFEPPPHAHGFARFRVRDDAGAFRAILCMVGFDAELPSDVVHIDAGERTGFVSPYYGARAEEADGYRYEVGRRGGWPLNKAIRLHVLPIDEGGGLG